MEKAIITSKSTVNEAYRKFEDDHYHSKNTRRSYRATVNSLQEDMISKGMEPILENINFDYVKSWEKQMHDENLSVKTIKQKLAVLASVFSHLNKLGILNGNPFLAIHLADPKNQNFHSRVLSISELYEVYKTADELESEGVFVSKPIKIAIFTGLRSTSLTKLQVRSVQQDNNGLIYKFDPMKDSEKDDKLLENYLDENQKSVSNTKNKEFYLPLPPKLISSLINSVENREPDEALLYGLKGKPLANKQMNYITDKVCEHLNWIEVDYENENTNDKRYKKMKKKKGDKVITKTEKFFSPHGFRYTIATLFHEMGVTEDGIRFLLGHSKYELGNLRFYIRSDVRYIKEIKAAQILMETLFETALSLEQRYNFKMDLEAIFLELPYAFEMQKRNPSYVDVFKDQLISFTLLNVQQQMSHSNNQIQPFDTMAFKAPVMNNPYQSMFTNGFVPVQSQMPYNGNMFHQVAPSNPMNHAGNYNFNAPMQQQQTPFQSFPMYGIK